MLHGCEIASHCLIGMHATILNDAKIGPYSIVGAGAVVMEGAVMPERSLILGLPAKVKRPLTDAEVASIDEYARRYHQYKETYLEMQGSPQRGNSR
jgi:carbonic anhydrase/acetyltransferase-like protein (isoleucine patch superfamily)